MVIFPLRHCAFRLINNINNEFVKFAYIIVAEQVVSQAFGNTTFKDVFEKEK